MATKVITGVGKGFVVTEVSHGLGQHKSRLSEADYSQFLKFDYLDWAQFFVALAVTKISIRLFLLRLSQFNKLKVILYGLIGFLVTTHVPLLLLYILQCDPVGKVWDHGLSGKCLSLNVVENIVIAQGGESLPYSFIDVAFCFVLCYTHFTDRVHQYSPS